MSAREGTIPVHPRAVRLMHWVNASATGIMMLSGWQIYNASPLLRFTFPTWSTLGGWLGGALLWHFAAMWALTINGGAYLVYALATGRLRRKFLPLSWRALRADVRAAVAFRLDHSVSVYNAVQKFSYLAVIALLALAILSGAAIWKPVQFEELSSLMGGFQRSRIVHFAAMTGILGFVVVHVAMSLLVPKSLVAMVRGH